MSPQPLRHTALPLLLVAVFATSAPANWFSNWFLPASHEELPTPQPTPDPVSSGVTVADDRMPTLVPPYQSSPYQSNRWADEDVSGPQWGEEGETIYSEIPAYPDSSVYPESFEGDLPVVDESEATRNRWPDVWAEEDADQGVRVFDRPFLSDLDGSATCCGSPKIRYWNHPLIGLASGHTESIERQFTILELAGECCPVQVPVTIPASVVGVPELETRQGLFGRTTHTFCWPCGYRLKIVRWGEGDLMVHTYNPPDAFPLQCMRSPSGGRLVEL